MHQYKILNIISPILIEYLYFYLYKNTTNDICHHVFIYDGRDKTTNSQTIRTKYIYRIHVEVECKMKSIVNK